ncbi:MAG: hypothetical protein V1824_01920 [archaeon]
MKKIEILFALVILILSMSTIIVDAEIIQEKTLAELGENDWILEKESNCKAFLITTLEDKDNSTFVFVLKIDNFIPVTDGLKLDIFLNNNLEKTLENKDIKEKNVIRLSNSNKLAEENSLSICANNNILPKLVISKNSTIGNYLLSEIRDDNFYQKVSSKIKSNTIEPVYLYVKNTGVKDINVKITNATDKFIEYSSLENVSGAVNFEGNLAAGEEKVLKYYIKTKKEVRQISPIAVLEYTDEFGQVIKKYTPQIIITVENEPVNLEVYVDLTKNVYANKIYNGKIILVNDSEKDLSNIFVELKFPAYSKLETSNISEIKKKDVIEIPFELKTYENDKYNLTVTATYDVDDIEKSSSSKIYTIESVNNILSAKTQIIGALLMLMIILYIWVVKI